MTKTQSRLKQLSNKFILCPSLVCFFINESLLICILHVLPKSQELRLWPPECYYTFKRWDLMRGLWEIWAGLWKGPWPLPTSYFLVGKWSVLLWHELSTIATWYPHQRAESSCPPDHELKSMRPNILLILCWSSQVFALVMASWLKGHWISGSASQSEQLRLAKEPRVVTCFHCSLILE